MLVSFLVQDRRREERVPT